MVMKIFPEYFLLAQQVQKKIDWIGRFFFRRANLLNNKARQDVHDKSTQSGIHGERLDDSAHEQHRERVLLHQLLHHHR